MVILFYLCLITYCVQEARGLKATFMGNGYLFYNLSKNNTPSYREEIVTLEFKTINENGLLFYTGNSECFINMGLANGSVYISTPVSKAGVRVEHPVGKKTPLNDGQWHKLTVTRRLVELNDTTRRFWISASVDGSKVSQWSTHVNFINFYSQTLYLGGAGNFNDIACTKAKQNWRGCLRSVSLSIDTVTLDLLQIGHNESNKLLTSVGSIKYNECEVVVSLPPITLGSSESYIELPIHKQAEKTVISFNFNTFVPTGLLLYIMGERHFTFAMELLDGYLEMIVVKGGNTEKTRCLDERVNDGEMHSVSASLEPDQVLAMIDGTEKLLTFNNHRKGFSFSSPLYLAGLDYSISNHKVKPLIYTAAMRQGYVGCLEHVMVNDVLQNVHSIAGKQKVNSMEGCMANYSSNCVDELCVVYEQSLAARFNGSQYLIANTPEMTRNSGAEKITLRFKTAHFYGYIFKATNKLDSSSFEVFLYGGKLFIRYKILNTIQTVDVANSICDNQWHLLSISRVIANITIKVDNQAPIISKISYKHDGVLAVEKVVLGTTAPDRVSRNNVVPTMEDLSTIPDFIGYLLVVEFNGVSYLPQMSIEKAEVQMNYTCELTTDSLPLFSTVTVKKEPIYVALSTSKPFATFTLHFKSRQSSALIFYGESASQMVGLELLEGHVYFYMGDKTNRSVVTSERNTFGDGEWHRVAMATRMHGSQHLIFMDTERHYTSMEEVTLTEIIFAGTSGSYADLPASMPSVSGLHGCIGSLELNGMRVNMMDSQVAQTSNISPGCPELVAVNCTSDYCQNGGKCTQVDKYYIKCQCLLTTYSGVTCSDEPIGYRFGVREPSGSKYVKYHIPVVKDTRNDTLAFRVATNSSNAPLIEITSNQYSEDKMAVTIWKGKAYLRFNIGGKDHHALGSEINDGQDHIIKVFRVGSKGSLEVDGVNRKTAETEAVVQNKDDKLKVFNSQSIVKIGGFKFVGDIKGLALNGEEIFSGNGILTSKGYVWRMDTRFTVSTADDLVVTTTPKETLCDVPCNPGNSSDDIITLTTWPNSNSKLIPSHPSTFTSIGNATASTITTRKRADITFQPSDGKTNKAFQMTENVPILAGISGAALITIMLIAIIACRLTRNRQSPKASTNGGTNKPHANGQTTPYAKDLHVDMNSSYSNGQPQTISKEWYV